MRVVLVNRFAYPDEAATSRMMSSLAFGLAARGLAAGGAEVHMIASRQSHDGSMSFPETETVRGVTFQRVATARFGRKNLAGRAANYLTFHLSAGLRIRRLARAGDVVIVGTDPPLLSVTAALALAGTGASLVNWMLDLFPEAAIRLGLLPADSLAVRLLCRLRDKSLREARLNVAPIGRMAELLIGRGVPSGNLVVMHQWSDGEAIRPLDPFDNPLREAWGLKDKVVVGYSGNFGRVHEFGTMLDAAERLRHRTDILFMFIGDGQKRVWIEEEVRRRKLGNVQMKPLQPRDKLCQSLGAADVHLVSLIPELEPCSVPSKFYGILAAGRPTLFVGDPDGEIARIIARTGCGATVAIGRDAELVAEIVSLADSPSVREAMGRAARQTFDAEFREGVGIAAWQRLLADLTAPAGRPSPSLAAAPVR